MTASMREQELPDTSVHGGRQDASAAVAPAAPSAAAPAAPSVGTPGLEDRLPLHFDDVLVSPYTDLVDEPSGGYFHRGGPCWPDWETQQAARHRRLGRPADTEPAPADPEARLPGPIAWGGPVDQNFGHQVGDFSMRLVPTLAVDADARVAFAAHPRWGWRSIDDTPVAFRQILDWVGLPEEQCVFIERPTLVEQLFVLPQAEQIGGPGPSEAHLDRMDGLVERRLGVSRERLPILYVSRAGMHSRLGGEAYLERVLALCGATVIRPETRPLHAQLRAYASADVVLFSGGSASTGARLLGRSLGDVTVLLRRHETVAEPFSKSQLEPRSRSLRYVEALRGVLAGTTSSGSRLEVLGLALLESDLLIESLHPAVPGLRDLWDAEAYAEARDADVLGWIDRALGQPYLQGEVARMHVLDTLTEAGLGHLVGPVDARLAAPPAPPAASPGHPGSDGDPVVAAPAEPGTRAPEARRVHPRPWTPTRLNQLVEWAGFRSYLEIGVGQGATLGEIRAAERTGVDPWPGVPAEIRGQPGVEIVTGSSDGFFARLEPWRRFDLVLLDGLHLFEQAYRDLCGALLHTGPDSIILLTDTWPRHEAAALRDRGKAVREQPAVGGPGTAWQGDVFKVLFALHDLHLGLVWATLDDWGSPQTMLWRSAHQPRIPLVGSLEAIGRLRFADLEQHQEVLRASGIGEAWRRYHARRQQGTDA